MGDPEIENLCEHVCNVLMETSNQERHYSLSRLRLMCGKSECGCPNMRPSQNLSCLLRAQKEDQIFNDYKVGLSIIQNSYTLAYEKHCRTALENMLRFSLSDFSTESRNQFLLQLWAYPGLRDFRIDMIEDLLYSESKFVEADIFTLFKESLRADMLAEHLWEDPRFERIIFWSCYSARIFCVVTSVLNAWLHKIVRTTNLCGSSFDVVSQFIQKVQLSCAVNNRDFVSLYPIEYQSLICLLDIIPDLFQNCEVNRVSVSISTVIALLKQNLLSKPVQTLCFLTHFSGWALFVNSEGQHFIRS